LGGGPNPGGETTFRLFPVRIMAHIIVEGLSALNA
jgi:hypothetical protein